MSIQGKGVFLWQVKRVAGGDANAIAEQAKAANLTHILIKVADGRYSYNITNGVDMVPALVTALRARGIAAWGWQYVYGSDPPAEAKKAIERVKLFKLDGFVVNAEAQFKAKGMDAKARKYMQELRKGLPGLPIGLSTYRYPTVHYQFPFTAFLDYCDFALPQVYWVGSVNPAQQLKKSYGEFQSLKPGLPVVPTGAAYSQGSWTPTPQQLNDFMAAARELQLPGANFWEMSTAQENGGALWSAVRDYDWATGSAPTPAPDEAEEEPPAPKPDIIARYISALNSGDPSKVTVLYEKNTAKHAHNGHTRTGRSAIYAWYNTLLKKSLPGGKFSVIGSSANGSTYTLQWKATAPKAKVQRGKDSIVMSSANPNLIAEHTTKFTIAKSITPGGTSIPAEYPEAGPIPV
ncbi:MAG: nuclear transport factor 2 family protein [Anaerolineales bacterium]